MSLEISNDLWDAFKMEEKTGVETLGSGSDTEEGEELCLHCDSENLLLDNGHVICKDCGTINSTSIDCNAEWRYYGNDESCA